MSGLGRSRAARAFKVLRFEFPAGAPSLCSQSSASAGVRYRADTSAAARVARPVMQQLNHPGNLKPHYEQSRVVASLSVATGLYNFVGVAFPVEFCHSRHLSWDSTAGGLVVLRLRSLATGAMLGAAAEARAGAGADSATGGEL